MNTTEPSKGDDLKAFSICCASKQGQYVNPDDIKWVHDLYRKHPQWASDMQARVFEATKPFGSK